MYLSNTDLFVIVVLLPGFAFLLFNVVCVEWKRFKVEEIDQWVLELEEKRKSLKYRIAATQINEHEIKKELNRALRDVEESLVDLKKKREQICG